MGERIEEFRKVHNQVSEMLMNSPAEGNCDYGRNEELVYMNMAFLKKSIEDLFWSIQEPLNREKDVNYQ